MHEGSNMYEDAFAQRHVCTKTLFHGFKKKIIYSSLFFSLLNFFDFFIINITLTLTLEK